MPRPASGTRSPPTHRQAHAVKNICGDALARENSTLTRNADGMRVCAMSHHTTLRKNRTRCSPTIRVFAGAQVRVNTHSPLAKNFAKKAVCGRVAGLTRAKTRESVHTDSLFGTARGVFARRAMESFAFVLVLSNDCVAASRRARRIERRAQLPIRCFNRSLTACGLALPPEAFIT